ncbi:MAG: HIT family protein [Gammaproteobacteria bacterium]|nr:HIT family protein [Gammaproteobacteria bacterium]MDG1882344.1 HIT family protein [Alphaproteobacteria bacterium]
MFKLDNRLENDSFFMQEIKNFQIRLMNVQEFFWIVLIPIKPNLIELSDLEVDERNELLNFAIDLGNYIKSDQNFDKVNIGMLGNVVAQLHLHIVLRNKDDPAWPGPVWGWKSTSNLDEETKQIRSKLIVQYLK